MFPAFFGILFLMGADEAIGAPLPAHLRPHGGLRDPAAERRMGRGEGGSGLGEKGGLVWLVRKAMRRGADA